MENVRKYHDNYDFVLKEALTLYTDKSLEFLGINAKVTELLNAENLEIEIRKTLEDQVVRLDTGGGANIEWESDISEDDILRFLAYNTALTRKYKIPFETVIVTREKPAKISYIGGSVKFTPKVVNLNKRSGRAALKEIRGKLDKGEPVNPLAVVYVPLYNITGMTYEDVYKAIIELMPKVTPNRHEQDMLLILSALLANKFVGEDEYKRILEAIKVALEDNKFFKLLKEEGSTERARIDARNLLELGVAVDIIKKGIGLSDHEIDEIQKELVPANS